MYIFANQTGVIPLGELDSNFSSVYNYVLTAGTVVNSTQTNITQVGTLRNLDVAGNITSATVSVLGTITAAANIITGGYFIGNIKGNITAPGANTQVLYNNNGTASASTGLTFNYATNSLAVIGNISANNISGNGSQLTSIVGNNVTGAVALATSAVTASTVTGNSQSNITSVGILTSLSVSGNTSSGNSAIIGQVSASGNITTAGYFVGNFIGNITGNLTVPGSNTQIIYNNNGNASASTALTFDTGTNILSVTGNIIGNIISGTRVSATGYISTPSIIGNTVSISGNITGNTINAVSSIIIPVFTSNTVRNTNISTPTAGMMAVVAGTFQGYDGTNWVTFTVS
jgi:hypothetical protein